MTAATTPAVTIDERTEAELQPRCDCGTVVYHPETMVIVDQQQCDQPAAWVLRSRCACGHLEIDLICHGHRAQLPTLNFWCQSCRTVREPIRQELERL